MKIAISSKGKTKDSLLDVRFGRCEYFQIYDTENEKINVVKNNGQVAEGGAGIAAAQQLIDRKVDVIITGNLGPNAFGLIDKANIKAYKCKSVSIDEALAQYNNGGLLELKEAGPAHHGADNGFGGGR
ncbi:MAG: NifB/NifX family molybdenum-iron cluster-binding protein [Xylanivirga thermophila]|jgi:predicted Fe-Mo cluster-binding NifX family protein|uniref:NifB/NifX family molybdenum-iron cluster-binding protein n=1 Tax=Xylanivirga thermophila TaxID=2496273 RepID=UPI00101BC5DB|nr:NifB/NifX family molybdenum-iron cluster-binding protein [Xylanivirga thermophila]